MRRRIVIELDVEGGELLVKDILRMVTGRVDADAEFSVRQEFLPELPSAIQVPEFLRRGCSYG